MDKYAHRPIHMKADAFTHRHMHTCKHIHELRVTLHPSNSTLHTCTHKSMPVYTHIIPTDLPLHLQPLTCLYIFSHPNQHPTSQPAVKTLTAFKQRVTTNFKRIIYAIKRIAALCKEANVLFLCLSTASLTILFFSIAIACKSTPRSSEGLWDMQASHNLLSAVVAFYCKRIQQNSPDPQTFLSFYFLIILFPSHSINNNMFFHL